MIDKIKSDLAVLKWMVSINYALTLLVLWLTITLY
jgi:hypothetical protein